MGDACEPRAKLAAGRVATLLDGGDGLDEGLLKDILGQLLATHNEKDIVEEFALIASKQLIERLIVTFRITCHQHVVGEHIQIFHYYLLLLFSVSVFR